MQVECRTQDGLGFRVPGKHEGRMPHTGGENKKRFISVKGKGLKTLRGMSEVLGAFARLLQIVDVCRVKDGCGLEQSQRVLDLSLVPHYQCLDIKRVPEKRGERGAIISTTDKKLGP